MERNKRGSVTVEKSNGRITKTKRNTFDSIPGMHAQLPILYLQISPSRKNFSISRIKTIRLVVVVSRCLQASLHLQTQKN
mmetsp:Transcript_29191/g.43013  ORF Transcript_29191/g.43013 Transcript_29191/m.43013 type:complete len:80 (-) Transcript_29191:61-300(-)